MKVETLEQIKLMRAENYPYSFIAKELDLSENTVKSLCRRNGFMAAGPRKTKSEKESAIFCQYCHKPLTGNHHAGIMFCSDSCRTKWHREHRKIVPK